ncbi:hypothetical protein [Pimelobacter sp. 30-1]|uniref:hypothetical protein n=1 Tax=Pimelobacter sp. 30-1 TaxID=2004991 RepID=UPI001C03E2A9|nr:hypothetical protein [Pimelobacter sp. 30-1]
MVERPAVGAHRVDVTDRRLTRPAQTHDGERVAEVNGADGPGEDVAGARGEERLVPARPGDLLVGPLERGTPELAGGAQVHAVTVRGRPAVGGGSKSTLCGQSQGIR